MTRENLILRDLRAAPRTFPTEAAWALRAAALRHGHLGTSYHLRAWEELARARGMRFDARRVRIEHLRRLQLLRAVASHLPDGDAA